MPPPGCGCSGMVSSEGRSSRRFYELPLVRSEHPALALSWTLYHVLDAQSPLHGRSTDDLEASSVSLVVVVSGYDVVAAQQCMREKPTIIRIFALANATPISSMHRKVAGSESTTAGSMKRWRNRLSHPCHANILCKPRGERAK
jgi:hypothetical protein